MEITPIGSMSATLEDLDVDVAHLILGGEASTATLTLTDSQLTLTEFLWIGPEATLEVYGSSSIPVAGMLNEGTLLAEGELLLLGSGTEPALTNGSAGSLLAGSVGLLQVSLPAGGTFTTSGAVQGCSGPGCDPVPPGEPRGPH